MRLAAYKPRIRTVLLMVNLVILLLPLLGIQALKLYENELIRQTEAALMAQGAYIREHYLAEVQALLRAADSATNPAHGVPQSEERYGIPVLPAFAASPTAAAEAFEPLLPSLDLAQETVRPPADEARETVTPADPFAAQAGDRLSPLLVKSQRYTLSGVRVVDFNGIVVASSRGELGRSLIHREEVLRALSGETISLLRERQTKDPSPPLQTISRGSLVRVFVGVPVVQAGQVLGAVILSRTPLDIEKALYLNRFVLLRYCAGLIVVVLLVSLLTATTISRPIQALIEQTERVQDRPDGEGGSPGRRDGGSGGASGSPRGDGTVPLAHPGSHEIRQLSVAIAGMARTMRERAHYIETFARNVSHEFKTPLATFLGTVELMRDHLDTMSKAERDRFLGMLASDAQRMEKLVSRLLQLAKADVISPPGGADTALAPALAALVVRFRALGLDVVLEPPCPPTLRARIAPEALDSLIANLLENARQHGGPGVRVRCSAAQDLHNGAPAARLSVQDDGPGISPANRLKVFDAFFTTARAAGGTGLGLAIVKAMVESHGGCVRLDTVEGARGIGISLLLPSHP